MKQSFIILFAIVFSLGLSAQEGQKTRKEKREEQKQQELAQQQANRTLQESWVENKSFVLEASQVFGQKGSLFQLTPSTNFVYVNGDQAIVQLSFNGLVGWNGVGGITIQGSINSFEYDVENKNKPIYLKMSIQGSDGFQDVTIWISSNGNGEAQVVDIKGNRIRFTGNVVSLEETKVFIGNSRF